MGDLEEKILKDCYKKPLTWWQYIDYIFVLWQYGKKELEKFLEFLNCYHPTIKLTADYSGEEIHFLDASVRKTNNQLVTDLYIKLTDKHQTGTDTKDIMSFLHLLLTADQEHQKVFHKVHYWFPKSEKFERYSCKSKSSLTSKK